MALKGQHTTADYLQWDEAMNLIRKLYRDGRYRDCMLIATGCFTLLRISDIRKLRYKDILDNEILTIIEQKTGKRREIALNKDCKKLVGDCFAKLEIRDRENLIFTGKLGGVITIQRINTILKEIKFKYKVNITNFSSHSLRKTGARRIYEMSEDREYALIKLSTVLNHSNAAITRRYLGIKREEILDCYKVLRF